MESNASQELFNQFQQTANQLRRYLRAAGAAVGDGDYLHGQGRLLRLLSERQGMAQKELAQLMKIQPASLSELLGKLETKGYVRRTRNEQDKRVYNVHLTPSGKRLVAELNQVKSNYGRDVFAVLDDKEARQLAATLDKLSAEIARQTETP